MRKIAFYGKGGIGKSTLTSSIAAAIAGMDKRVMQIGCDPKADSTLNLRAGQELTSVMDVLQAYGGLCPSLDAISVKGYRGIVCVEAVAPRLEVVVLVAALSRPLILWTILMHFRFMPRNMCSSMCLAMWYAVGLQFPFDRDMLMRW